MSQDIEDTVNPRQVRGVSFGAGGWPIEHAQSFSIDIRGLENFGNGSKNFHK
jgi:hypothetical protein